MLFLNFGSAYHAAGSLPQTPLKQSNIAIPSGSPYSTGHSQRINPNRNSVYQHQRDLFILLTQLAGYLVGDSATKTVTKYQCGLAGFGCDQLLRKCCQILQCCA